MIEFTFGLVILAKGENGFSESLNGSKKQKWLKRPYGENSSRWGFKYWAKTHVNMFLDADGWTQWLSPHGDNLTYCQTRPVFPRPGWPRPLSKAIVAITTNQISAAPQRAPAFIFQIPGGRLESGNQIRHVGTGEGLWVFFWGACG